MPIETVSGFIPFTVNFTDASTGADEWLWDFGDDTTSTQASPNHTYDQAGTFNVSLTVSNSTANHTFTVASAVIATQPGGEGDDASYALNIAITGNGTVDQGGISPYDAGTVVQLEAIPSSGNSFDRWLGGEVQNSYSATTSITMNSVKNIRAKFSSNA